MLYFCCAGYPSAMTMLAVALLTIVAVSYHHRRVTPILPLAIGRTASTRLRSPPEKAPNPPRQNTGSVQIPIAPDAPPSHIFRGFLLWRFAYASPPVRAAPPSWGRHPQTFTIPDSCTAASSPFIRSFRRQWKAPFWGGHFNRIRLRLLLARIVCWVDIIDGPRPNELN